VPTHRIMQGVAGQTLKHVLPERIVTVSYAIESMQEARGTAARTVSSGSATVLGVSLTTDAAAGPGQANGRKVPVSATTLASVGQELVIVGLDGQFEAFTVDGVVSADYLMATAPLVGDYASGSAVYGLEASASVPADLYNDEDALKQQTQFRVVWTYTTAAGPRKVQEPIQFEWLSAEQFSVGEAIANLRRGYGHLVSRLPTGLDLRSAADYCTADLLAKLSTHGERTQRLAMGDTGRRLLELRMLVHIGEHGLAPGGADPEVWTRLSEKRFDAAFAAFVVGEPGADVVHTTIHDQATGRDRTYRGPVISP
jgi:hypothetical protein